MMKFLKILVITILLLIVALVVGGYIFLKTFDLNKYKDQITALVSKELGRELTIKGDASIAVSLVPTIVIQDIQLSNAAWAAVPVMVGVKKVEVSFAIMPLFKKQIVVDNISIDGPVINLEVSKDGKPNWVFEKPVDANAPAAAAPAPAAAPAKSIDSSMALLGGLAARNVAVTNGTVTYNAAGKTMTAVINKIALSIPSMDDKIKASVDVVLDNNPIAAEATVGSINTFLAKGAYPVAVAAKAFGASAKVSGQLENILADLGFDLDVQASNPAGNFGAPEVNFVGHAKGDLKKVAVDIDNLEAAKNKITGKVMADISGKLPVVSANLAGDLIDVTSLTAKPMAFEMPEVISSAQATALVPNDKFPYEFLQMANATLALDVKKLIIQQGVMATDVKMASTLQDGVLGINPLSLNFNGGDITAVAQVNANSKSAALRASTKGMLLQNLHQGFVVKGPGTFGVKEGGAVDIDIDVTTSGDTYRQLVEGLNGRFIVVVDKSTFATGSSQFFDGTFLQRVAQTLKIDKVFKSDINLNCAVVRTDFADGKASFPNGIGIDSVQMNLSSTGTVNLISDAIDFTMQPSISNASATNIAQALTSFLKVYGTIQNPQVGIDDKQALKTAVGAALNPSAYAGGSVLANGNAAPCYTALAGTKFATRFPNKVGQSASAQDIYKDAAKEVKDNVKAVVTDAKQNVDTLKQSGQQLLNSFKSLGKNK